MAVVGVPLKRRVIGTVLAVAALALPLAPRVLADPPTHETGYVPVAVGTLDETTLHYKVMLPDAERWGPGPYPAVIDYSGYLPAQSIYDGLDDRFTAAGYAVVGLNMRGSGCSGGKFDYFEPRQAKDGAEAIEWLATRDWSNGKFAMVGKSYPGITQLFVAAQQPEHLVAIVPGHVFGDLYRDVPWPGGILNATFAAGWSANRYEEGYANPPQWSLEQNDQQCLQNFVGHVPNAAFNPLVQGSQPQNHFDSEFYRVRSPFWFADKIDVPTFLVQSWQDEQVGSRATNLIERLRPGLDWRMLVTNGDHGEYYGDEVFPHILAFLDQHVKQDAPTPEYLAQDRVIVNWENGAKGGRNANWTETYPTWPVPGLTPWRLQLGADGRLTEGAGVAGKVDYTYLSEVGSQERGGFDIAGEPPATWADRPPDGMAASFTTPVLDADKVLLGSASLDLLVSSTAPDTDFEVTLTELRPDGKEVFVQQGWLRASHRKEMPELSTELRPFQTHQILDVQPLVPTQPTPMRLEIFPFGHVFRAGSQLRITVAAPHTWPDLWGFVSLPVPAINSIHTGPGASSLALPLVDGAVAGAPLPPCTLRNQPCR
jgi:putative CocE/NonD family hydrolase